LKRELVESERVGKQRLLERSLTVSDQSPGETPGKTLEAIKREHTVLLLVEAATKGGRQARLVEGSIRQIKRS
jgi:hypothetical protein